MEVIIITDKEMMEIINFEKCSTEGEHLEAWIKFTKKMFDIDVQNENGSYKTLGEIATEYQNNKIKEKTK